jgi:hypothetical protein
MIVIHHSDCGTQLFTNESIGDLVQDDLGTAQFDAKKWSNANQACGSVAISVIGTYIRGQREECRRRRTAEFVLTRWCRGTSGLTALSMM